MISFAVSTTAFRRTPIEQVLALAEKEKLALEFSSGLPYREDMIAIYRAAKNVQRLPHNYFPAPKEPFVLNVASIKPEVADKSVEHCLGGLRLAAEAGAPFFSAHAGFCLDPEPRELGHKLKFQQTAERSVYWAKFVANVKILAAEAEKLGVKFLVENNVVAPMNVQPDGTIPLLCVAADEILRLKQEVPSRGLGILLDTGHLKVSAQTMGYDADACVKEIAHLVDGLHHSDNDGKDDSNHPLTENYWFLKHMPLFQKATHVLEVHDQKMPEIRFQEELLNKAARK